MPVRSEPFARDHLGAILALCETQGWPSLPADPRRAEQALTAPGVTTVVAVDGNEVAGFATILTDGVIDAYLSLLLVEESHRGAGIGDALVHDVYRSSGATRVDLLAEVGSDGFYRRFPHRRLAGFRLYPDAPRDDVSGRA